MVLKALGFEPTIEEIQKLVRYWFDEYRGDIGNMNKNFDD